MLTLTIIEGPDAGRRFELPDDEPQLLGRSSEALPISDNTVSRRHAELTPDNGEWWLRDLESQNGTWINGQRLVDRVRLRAGDRVRVGSTLIVFGAPDTPTQGLVRVVADSLLETNFETTLASNDDSVILAEPEPSAAAIHHLRVIYRLTTLTARVTDRKDLLNAVMELVFSEFGPEKGFIMLRDGEAPLAPAVVKHREPPRDPARARIHVSRTILQHCIQKREGVLSTNAMNDPRFRSGDSVQQFEIHSAICAPISHHDRVYGAIYIDSSVANYSFTSEQLALMNAIGQQSGLALANLELGEQKIHAERLAAMGETVASLSHSIKNILQGLRGGADLVEMGLKRQDLEVATDGWGILKRNMDRIVGLTMNMLAFSRQKELDVDLTPLNRLIEECAELLEPACRARGVRMHLDPDGELPLIPLDSSLMHQALMNLMTNAVEAAPNEHGQVTVRTIYHVPDPLLHAQPPYVEVQVIDNGEGIGPERLRWIFEPFKTTKGSRGTGLGLAVTRRIIDSHRGRIEVLSRGGGPGAAAGGPSGSVFRVILPAEGDAALDPAATKAEGERVELEGLE